MVYLELGKIIKTRGLKGVVKVYSTTEFAPQRYKKGNKVYLQNEQTKETKEMTIASYSFEQGFDYVSFEGYEDINLIEPYLHYVIVVNKDELPPLPKDTYYYDDLQGCEVEEEYLGKIGVVNAVNDYNGKKSIMVKLFSNNKTIQIPFVEAFVKDVDITKKIIKVKLIKGMID